MVSALPGLDQGEAALRHGQVVQQQRGEGPEEGRRGGSGRARPHVAEAEEGRVDLAALHHPRAAVAGLAVVLVAGEVDDVELAAAGIGENRCVRVAECGQMLAHMHLKILVPSEYWMYRISMAWLRLDWSFSLVGAVILSFLARRNRSLNCSLDDIVILARSGQCVCKPWSSRILISLPFGSSKSKALLLYNSRKDI